MVKDKPLTIKQKKFVRAYVNNDGNGRDAAKAVYDVKTDGVAASIASENLNKPNVKAAIELALEKHGITIEKATKPIADGLTAEQEFIDKNGDSHAKPDHNVRLKASGMALKLMGAEQKPEVIPQAVHFHNHQAQQRETYDL